MPSPSARHHRTQMSTSAVAAPTSSLRLHLPHAAPPRHSLNGEPEQQHCATLGIDDAAPIASALVEQTDFPSLPNAWRAAVRARPHLPVTIANRRVLQHTHEGARYPFIRAIVAELFALAALQRRSIDITPPVVLPHRAASPHALTGSAPRSPLGWTAPMGCSRLAICRLTDALDASRRS